MKINMKKMLCMVLAAVMIVSLLPAATVTSEAATKNEKTTMFAGETMDFYLFGTTITSVSSSNKKVVKAKRDSSAKYKALFTAKKKGSATVTIKSTGGTVKYKITVLDTTKSFDFYVAPINKSTGADMLLKVKNKTKLNVSSIGVDYTLRDSNGNEIETANTSVRGLAAKSTGYSSIYVSTNNINLGVDLSKTTFIIKSITRTNKTKNLKKKVTVKEKDASFDGNTLNVTVSAKNKASVYANVYITIIAKDAADNIIGFTNTGVYPKKDNGLETKIISVYLPRDTDTSSVSYSLSWTAVS